MKLVLFDLDGTLLAGGGAGRRAIQRALLESFGTAGPPDHPFDGKTDPQIVRELMDCAGVHCERVSERMQDVLTRYADYLDEELAQPAHGAYAMKGAAQVLDALEARSDVTLGLLTGNLQRGAIAKLRAVGIDPHRFRVGAFGSDHEHRPELPAIAIRRAIQVLSREIPGHAAVVIGDTPADLTCGLGIGARAIGVATGRFAREELSRYAAAAVFDDLSDTEGVVSAIVRA